MSVLLATHFCLAIAMIEIDLAPDQPLPYVYVDDPLILELRSSEDAQAAVHLTVQAAHDDAAAEVTLGPFLLRAGGSHWCAVRGLPEARGYYTAHIEVRIGEARTEKTAHFCRIDRLNPACSLPFYGHGRGVDGPAQFALRAVAVKTLRLDASRLDMEQRIADAVAANFDLVIHLNPEYLSDPAQHAGRLAERFCSHIVRWELDCHDHPGVLMDVAEAIREAGCAAPLAVTLPSPDAFRPLLERNAGSYLRDVVLLLDATAEADAAPVRELAERAGYEAWRVHALARGIPSEGMAAGAALARQLLENLASGITQTGFEPALAYDGEVGESLAYLNGLAQRLVGAEFAGSLPFAPPGRALVFRQGNAWFLALWTDGAPSEITLEFGDAQDIRLTDALNNPLPLPERIEGNIRLRVEREPQYLTGAGGAALGLAARTKAWEFARQMAECPPFRRFLAPALMDVVAGIAAQGGGAASRDDFFRLLRQFPVLERQWHSQQIPQAVAVPAMARLARLARALATVEQDRGVPFLEPLPDTLARCEEYQSLYLTGSVGVSGGHERGDWLLNEVRRLMDEALSLAGCGLRIEATAVAALAEWRARGLEYAAQSRPGHQAITDMRFLDDAAWEAASPEGAGAGESVSATNEGEPPLSRGAAAETLPEEPPVEEEVAPRIEELVHTVAAGDNPSRIARKYGVDVDRLLEWNGLTRRSILSIGDTLVVRRTVEPETAP